MTRISMISFNECLYCYAKCGPYPQLCTEHAATSSEILLEGKTKMIEHAMQEWSSIIQEHQELNDKFQRVLMAYADLTVISTAYQHRVSRTHFHKRVIATVKKNDVFAKLVAAWYTSVLLKEEFDKLEVMLWSYNYAKKN